MYATVKLDTVQTAILHVTLSVSSQRQLYHADVINLHILRLIRMPLIEEVALNQSSGQYKTFGEVLDETSKSSKSKYNFFPGGAEMSLTNFMANNPVVVFPSKLKNV